MAKSFMEQSRDAWIKLAEVREERIELLEGKLAHVNKALADHDLKRDDAERRIENLHALRESLKLEGNR